MKRRGEPYMKIKGKPVHPFPKHKPFCAIYYKGTTYAFVAHDDTYCTSPLTGELLLRNQPREYYLDHVKQMLKEFPDLEPVY